ncbi:MAG: penicillin-binding protein 2, partial [Chloroflexi bacterium]|nr:penicillin-binding protein 2 [Chloroflexota bacterium]
TGVIAAEFRPIVPLDARLSPEYPNGVDLYLTVDRDIQAEVERALADALRSSGASGGLILVTNPHTGEILAIASTPGYDPNNYADYPEEALTNPAISGQYEPGSVFKPLTMAGAIDAGIVTPDTPFMDVGYIEVGGLVIRNWDGGAWGLQTMLGCLQHSLNVCLSQVAVWMGPNLFYNYMNAFGIGRLTNVDLAGEQPGRLKRPGDEDWYDSDLGTNSFGQGVAVTPLQLATALGAIANGGAMMQPHVLKAVVQKSEVHTVQPQVMGRPIRRETAATVNELLVRSLELEASAALVPGYLVAGKTGTAQIPIPGGYDPQGTIASFVGWLPADNPQMLILVKLDRPTTSPWGSVVAAPVFSQLAQRLVVMLEIPPDAMRSGQHTCPGRRCRGVAGQGN